MAETLPLVITAKLNNAIRLIHLDEAADLLGLQTGMSLTDARAAFPQIEAIEQETDADHLLLEAIADWADRYTPLVAIDGADRPAGQTGFGLMLDITGCAHLFGGEKALMADLLSRLFQQGFAAMAAIAPTPGAAWAMTRFRGNTPLHHSQPPHSHGGLQVADTLEDVEAALAPLPIAALRLPGETVAGLARLGLRTVGQLKLRPRAPLARRFGRELLYRFDQAYGAVEEAISPRRPVPELMAERRFAEPLILEADLLTVTGRLAGHLCMEMEKQAKGARQMALSLYRVDGKVAHITAGTSRPMRDPVRITALFRERLASLHEEYDPGFGFETVRLAIAASEPMEASQQDMMGNDAEDGAAHLMDRLAARIGPENISRTALADSHLPEEAETGLLPGRSGSQVTPPERLEPSGQPHATSPFLHGITRPLRLFACPEPVEAVAEVPEGPPIRFRWRRVLHKVMRAEGPERIADTWWNKCTPRRTRDYYRIEDEAGHRYWLFREGLYGRETETPRWFMHGLFA